MKETATGILPFISQLVASLAWPGTILICVFLLRHHLKALLPLVRSVKYSDVEIKFGKDVAELAKSTETSLPPLTSTAQGSDRWDDVHKMIEVRPRTAIRVAFRRLEEAIIATAEAKHIDLSDGAMGMPMVAGAILLNNGVITTEQYDVLSRLRALLSESEIAPPDSIKSESAAEFVDLASRLAASLSVRAGDL